MVDEKFVKSDRILEEMLRRLVTAFHPDRIYPSSPEDPPLTTIPPSFSCFPSV